jgi:Family of unknown function (DUF6328)
MPDSQSAGGETRHETHLERLDRNLEGMAGELRVVVTGVQVLFAFLLIVPFNTGFAHVGNRVVIAGLAFLALAMCGCLLLVTTKLFGLTAGVFTASIGALPFAVLWFALPPRRVRRLEESQYGSTRDR